MPDFSSTLEAVNWYEAQGRILTKEYINTIPWEDVKNHELNKEFIPVLLYMRDVERFTEIYYRELLKTPTGRDPQIRRFMDKWSTEEPTHAELLNRFLNEAGYSTSEKWFEEAKSKIPFSYKVSSWLSSNLANAVGKNFTAVHMTWGAINEATTLTGYRRLWEKADHPVLTYILKAIAREESMHTHFYWSLARLKLIESKFAQDVTNFIVRKFWTPVGQGTKPEEDTNYVLKALFDGEEGVKTMDTFVNKRIELLPGMKGLKTITNRIAEVAAPDFIHKTSVATS